VLHVSFFLTPLSLFAYVSDDCCVTSSKEFCAECKCKYDLSLLLLRHEIFPNETCPYEFMGAMGDGFCHDELNNPDCKYDGGDCCLDEVNTNVCETCKCMDPKKKDNIIKMEANCTTTYLDEIGIES
jgi:hypothetical protein